MQGQSASRTEELLLVASSKVFLLGPSSQQYLFLPKEVRKAWTKRPKSSRNLPSGDPSKPRSGKSVPQELLDEAETVLAGFLAYDWLSVEPLVELFLDARDEDFERVAQPILWRAIYDPAQRGQRASLGKRVRPLVES